MLAEYNEICIVAHVNDVPAASISSFVDHLQERGRYTFTLEEARALGGRSESGLQLALARLKKRKRLVAPRRGFFVIVPLEYRQAGAPPASWYIDDLMKWMEQPYYVSLLTAAALHGAAHQQPMAFQVMTDRPTRPARAGRTKIEFHMHRDVGAIPTSSVQTETGSMQISTPEATAFDLVRYHEAAGYMANVANVLTELAEELDAARLAEIAPLYSVPDVQRLGYLLEALGCGELALSMEQWLVGRARRAVPLAGEKPAAGIAADSRWKVLPNTQLEPDL